MLHIYDISSQKETNSFPTGHNFVKTITYSPDGTKLVTSGYDKKVVSWDPFSGKKLHTFQGDDVFVQVDDHTNRQFYLSGSDNESVYCSAFSQDGSMLAYGSLNHKAYLWNFNERYLIAILEGHQDGIADISFSGDDKYIITGSYDGSIKIW